MESSGNWVGIITAATVGFLLHEALARRLPTAPSFAPPTPAFPGNPTVQELAHEVRNMRLEMQEWLEKIEHLYGRIRKRARLREEDQVATDHATRASALTPLAPVLTEADILARARARGWGSATNQR